jgi:hypothetical protein
MSEQLNDESAREAARQATLDRECAVMVPRGQVAAAVMEERVRCIRDACCYCNGNCPQYSRTPVFRTDGSANWTHSGDGYADPKPVALCEATGILNRAKFHGQIALTIWALGQRAR